MQPLPKIAFFGTPYIAVSVLEVLASRGILPSFIITNPDAPQGRKMTLTPSPTSDWASAHSIETYKPATLNSDEVVTKLKDSGCELFIVAAYGKIIPQSILDIPKYKTLNVHPSLLPHYRGASPIRTAILEDTNPTGVSIMILTAGIDEGPVLAQEEVLFQKSEWPVKGRLLDTILAEKGGALLANLIPEWIEGSVKEKEQDHTKATFSKKITKEMGLLNLHDDPYKNYLKICAFDGWPGTYFFHHKHGKEVRVKIIDAEFVDNRLNITRVVPEGKKEMRWEEFNK